MVIVLVGAHIEAQNPLSVQDINVVLQDLLGQKDTFWCIRLKVAVVKMQCWSKWILGVKHLRKNKKRNTPVTLFSLCIIG